MALTAINQSANDTFPAKSNGVERTVGLGNVPADFGNATAVDITVDGSLTGFNNDESCELDVWVETPGGTLLASDASSWKQVQSRSSDGSFTTSALSFNTINTTADKADWDGALLRYRQTITGVNMGADSVSYTTTTTTDLDITYDVTSGPEEFFETIAATSSGVATLTKVSSFKRVISAASNGVALLDKGLVLSKAITATASNIAAVLNIKSYLRTISAISIGLAALTKGLVFQKAIAATGIGIAALSLSSVVSVSVSAVATGIAVISGLTLFSILIAASSTGSVGLSKRIGKTIQAIASGNTTLLKEITKTITATAAGVASITKQITKTFLVVAVGVPIVLGGLVVLHAINAISAGVAIVNENFIIKVGISFTLITGIFRKVFKNIWRKVFRNIKDDQDGG